ncbi:MAG TPA: 5-formyltetrahydrofolate cyclo-ligase [Woeseiaceae bacterium]|nr:5-formyltetrahydrofolate cyclo-ligase [Woeseiaceae bacterium]
MKDWPSIQAWRKATRKDFIEKRLRIPRAERQSAQQAVGDLIRDNFSDLDDAAIGFYWPIKGEIDLRPLMQALLADGADAALPVVAEKNQPLEFWAWQSGTKMSRGAGNIPVPGERKLVQPTVLLIPLLGFDTSGHRLGYGGGYYDRTLASYRLKPVTIGVGYEFGRLPTIYPQAHDIPLDAIVSELGCTRFDKIRPGESRVFSPPCYLHEVEGDTDPS